MVSDDGTPMTSLGLQVEGRVGVDLYPSLIWSRPLYTSRGVSNTRFSYIIIKKFTFPFTVKSIPALPNLNRGIQIDVDKICRVANRSISFAEYGIISEVPKLSTR